MFWCPFDSEALNKWLLPARRNGQPFDTRDPACHLRTTARTSSIVNYKRNSPCCLVAADPSQAILVTQGEVPLARFEFRRRPRGTMIHHTSELLYGKSFGIQDTDTTFGGDLS